MSDVCDVLFNNTMLHTCDMSHKAMDKYYLIIITLYLVTYQRLYENIYFQTEDVIKPVRLEYRVPQGSVLGPKMYTKPLGDFLKSCTGYPL